MDGIFVAHHERTGASLILSERGLLRGTESSAEKPQTSGTTNSEEFRGCIIIGEEPEVRPPPVPAVVMSQLSERHNRGVGTL